VKEDDEKEEGVAGDDARDEGDDEDDDEDDEDDEDEDEDEDEEDDEEGGELAVQCIDLELLLTTSQANDSARSALTFRISREKDSG
jgi:predicted adenine nucleotide alpha hydrolase (AANH) superfamily ATPase